MVLVWSEACSMLEEQQLQSEIQSISSVRCSLCTVCIQLVRLLLGSCATKQPLLTCHPHSLHPFLPLPRSGYPLKITLVGSASEKRNTFFVIFRVKISIFNATLYIHRYFALKHRSCWVLFQGHYNRWSASDHDSGSISNRCTSRSFRNLLARVKT